MTCPSASMAVRLLMTLLLLTFQYCGDFTQQVAARRPHSAVRPPKPFFIEEAQSFFRFSSPLHAVFIRRWLLAHLPIDPCRLRLASCITSPSRFTRGDIGEKYAGLISLINADFRHKLSLARAILIGLDACMIRARTLNTWIKKPSGLRSAQRSHSPSCSWTVMVELIHRSRSTNII